MFSGLVYTQIWEDPYIDLEALALEPEQRLVTISSAGCNALNYLTAHPVQIEVVDLNSAHLSLLELKIATLCTCSNYTDFERFFAQATNVENVELYDRLIHWRLSTTARIYWNSPVRKKRRIEMFKNGFYRFGLLGQFIRFIKIYANLCRVDLTEWARCKTQEEQVIWFNRNAPRIFKNKIAQLLCRSPLVLYYLGIPPRQFQELCNGDPNQMACILEERARALLTIGSVDDNYFAWQATTGAYRIGGPYPPYLKPEYFEILRTRVNRLALHQIGFRQYLETCADQSIDRFILLDAQDWMDAKEIQRLWSEMSRTAKPHARLIFRSAGSFWRAADCLPLSIKKQWATDESVNLAFTARDMSGIYGRFHLYHFKT